MAHGHFAFTFAADHLKTYHGCSIQTGSRTRRRQGIADLGHLVQAHACATGCGQLNLADLLCGFDRSQGAYSLLANAQVHSPTRAFLLNLFELARHFSRGDTQRLQAVNVKRNVHFARDSADSVYCAYATQGQEFAGNLLVDHPRQGLVIHAV